MTNEKEIIFEPFEQQQEFINAVLEGKIKYPMYGGSIRSGKTFTCLAILLVMCKVFAGSRWFVIRHDLPTIKRNVLPTFHKICPTNFLKDFNKSDFTATFQGGSQIIFMPESIESDSELRRFRGLEANGFLLEECGEMKKKTFSACVERSGTWKMDNMPPDLVMTNCNPTQGWPKTDYYMPFQTGQLKPPYYFQQANIFDNPHLPEGYLDSLKQLPEPIYKRFVLGSWDTIDELNQLISWEAIHECAGLIKDESEDQFLGVDVARFGNDKTVFVRLKGSNIEDIRQFDRTDIVQVADITKKMIVEHNISADNVVVDSVGLGAGVVDILQREGYNVFAFSGGAAEVQMGERTLYSFSNLRAQSYWSLSEAIKKHEIGNLTHETLKADLAATWYFISGDKKIKIESKDDLIKRIGRSPDFADGLCYANWARVRQGMGGSMIYTMADLMKDMA